MKNQEKKKKALKPKLSVGLVIDTVIAWSLLYMQTLAQELASQGKIMNRRQRWTCLTLYWVATQLAKLRNYDDIYHGEPNAKTRPEVPGKA